MKFSIDIGNQERHRIDYARNWFTGDERLSVDGEVIARRSVLSLSNYVSSLVRRHDFTVGQTERHSVAFEKERPLVFAGFRPHTYRLFVDGALVLERSGY